MSFRYIRFILILSYVLLVYGLSASADAISDYNSERNATAYSNRGDAWLKMETLEKARADYDKAIHLNSEDKHAKHALGRVRKLKDKHKRHTFTGTWKFKSTVDQKTDKKTTTASIVAESMAQPVGAMSFQPIQPKLILRCSGKDVAVVLETSDSIEPTSVSSTLLPDGQSYIYTVRVRFDKGKAQKKEVNPENSSDYDGSPYGFYNAYKFNSPESIVYMAQDKKRMLIEYSRDGEPQLLGFDLSGINGAIKKLNCLQRLK